MVNKLIINKTTNTPRIMFDPDRKIYEIKGNSYPENTAETYQPVLHWIENELTKVDSEVVIEFKLDYQNTASSKMIMDFNRGVAVKVRDSLKSRKEEIPT